MDTVKEKNKIAAAYIAAAFFLSLISCCLGSVLPGVAAFVFTFAATGKLSYAKKHETLWVFLIASVICIPMNIRLAVSVLEISFMREAEAGMWRASLAILYIQIFCTQEAALCYISRLIWKNQEEIFPNED